MSEHSFIWSHKIFTEKLRKDHCWAVELACGLVIQLCGFREDEKKAHKIYCPTHKRLEDMIRTKQIPLEVEG